MQQNSIKLLLLAIIICCFSVNVAFAAPNAKQINQIEKQITKLQRRLQKLFEQLNAAQQGQLIASRNARSLDSDEDGVPDLYDSGRCDSDSDEDGLDDGEEFENGSDPNDSDSDDDGIEDDEDDSNDNEDEGGDNEDPIEIELKGRIVGITEQNMKVGDRYFVLTPETKFLNAQGNPTNRSQFVANICVELKAIEHPGEDLPVVIKVKLADGCAE